MTMGKLLEHAKTKRNLIKLRMSTVRKTTPLWYRLEGDLNFWQGKVAHYEAMQEIGE